MSILKRWFWNKFYQFKYRKIDEDVCCCGSSNCDGDYSHSYVNAKQFAITSCVINKLNH
jgi:hypothetical protein